MSHGGEQPDQGGQADGGEAAADASDGPDPADTPNLTITADRGVHLGEDDQLPDEGSIIAAPQHDYAINPDKDPKISHFPPHNEQQAQSKCCLLL
jgi:hypothetical protein